MRAALATGPELTETLPGGLRGGCRLLISPDPELPGVWKWEPVSILLQPEFPRPYLAPAPGDAL